MTLSYRLVIKKEMAIVSQYWLNFFDMGRNFEKLFQNSKKYVRKQIQNQF